ncbi:hypothetical protein T07_9541 [Trichinella nelsoni]|uniref:Uncharacterized protein n=1 Tax=Trichinella nelsoni TaxID=6336 RepID=A0A0V0RF62_9BILA|nr:hypothetical protein T07_9541 [Trichinella nelsoni]
MPAPGEATTNVQNPWWLPLHPDIVHFHLTFQASPDSHFADNGNTTCSLLPCVSVSGRLPEGTLRKRQHRGHPCISGSCL